MLYLLDANVLITAKDSYYPVDAVPEFWEWLEHMGRRGNVKIPLEIFEEIKEGPKRPERDLLFDWIQQAHVRQALLLDEAVDLALVQRAVNEGYAPDLTDAEVDELGRDPFWWPTDWQTQRAAASSRRKRPGPARAARTARCPMSARTSACHGAGRSSSTGSWVSVHAGRPASAEALCCTMALRLTDVPMFVTAPSQGGLGSAAIQEP